MAQDFITQVYNAFNPFEPLKPGDPAYVNCSEVRGNEDIFREIGRKILRSDPYTCQLYTGHRGAGKSTELLRLKEYLEKKGCFVVYFGATEGDIDEQDAQYTDILLACTRHILEELKNYAKPDPLLHWLNSRWDSLKELALSEVDFSQLTIEAQINIFAKLTASLRRIPRSREIIREQVDLNSISLIDALNQFIAEAQQQFNSQNKLVIIADNLDRIVPVFRENGHTNHEEIFLDYNSQLTALNCHVVYTIPISLAYSKQATELRNLYDTPQILPMIMIKDRNDQPCEAGLNKVKEIFEKRIHPIATKNQRDNIDIDTDIFESAETRLELCRMSGGHVREMMLLMQTSMDSVDNFPITNSAINYAINEARDRTYRSAVNHDEWVKLVAVYRSKNIPNESEYRDLLFRRCVLEYRSPNLNGDCTSWYDVHPMIIDIEEFQYALNHTEIYG